MTPKQALENILETLKDVRKNPLAFLIEETNTNKYAKVIEQALIEHEKQTQILEVLKKKKVNLFLIHVLNKRSTYNGCSELMPDLTETEFNLIKEWLKWKV